MTRRDAVSSFAVYDGRRYLGEVAELGTGQFAAIGRDDKDLGVFDRRRDAELAVVRHRAPASFGRSNAEG